MTTIDPSSLDPDPDPEPERFWHVALVADWQDALRSGRYAASTRGASLAEVGYVHGAFDHQVAAVVERFYADLDEIVLLTIETSRLDAEVRVEPPADGIDELFPHVYGPIPVHAVISARTLAPSELTSGRFREHP